MNTTTAKTGSDDERRLLALRVTLLGSTIRRLRRQAATIRRRIITHPDFDPNVEAGAE